MVGVGYVGLTSGTCLAEIGHHVTCIDIDRQKIEDLNNAHMPIYEPGLLELLERNTKAERLKFASSYESVGDAQFVFLAVGTPSHEAGGANLEYLENALSRIAGKIAPGTVIIIKSTVPPGTAGKIREKLKKLTDKEFFLVSNPEFLREGSAINDFMRPDRVVIGHKEQKAFDLMEELYSPLLRQGNPLHSVSNVSAELSKYAANAFLATKISFINEMARLCESIGADIEEVRTVLKSDPRIGKHFLYPGPGFGGSCFPKDIDSLVFIAENLGVDLQIVSATKRVNQAQKILLLQKIKRHFDSLEDKVFAIWGVAFKPETDDVRESPAIALVDALIAHKAKIHFYDPVAANNFAKFGQGRWSNNVFRHDDKISCLSQAHALIIMTEWREFKNPNWDKLKELLVAPVIFDARNIYHPQKVKKAGFTYYSVGRRS